MTEREQNRVAAIWADYYWAPRLAHNLYAAFCLCRSYELGGGIEIGPPVRHKLSFGWAVIPAAIWRPGIGVKAP